MWYELINLTDCAQSHWIIHNEALPWGSASLVKIFILMLSMEFMNIFSMELASNSSLRFINFMHFQLLFMVLSSSTKFPWAWRLDLFLWQFYMNEFIMKCNKSLTNIERFHYLKFALKRKIALKLLSNVNYFIA